MKTMKKYNLADTNIIKFETGLNPAETYLDEIWLHVHVTEVLRQKGLLFDVLICAEVNTLTPKMTSSQVAKTSVINNNSFPQDSMHADNQLSSRY